MTRYLHATLLLASSALRFNNAFIPQTCLRPSLLRTTTTPSVSRLFASSATTLPDISGMRASEMKSELESYGISTKSFLEKKELIEALTKARDEGKTPIKKPSSSTRATSRSTASTSSTASSSTSSSTTTSDTSTTTDTRSRSERIQEEMQTIQSMKATDIRKELQSLGVSTKSLFEKSEFVKALAEARVDGVKQQQKDNDEEGYAEYTNVEVLPADDPGPRKKKSQEESSGPSGAGSSDPFGGMGGMGGMGGIADMLKNMGGMNGQTPSSSSSSSSSPFGSGNMADMFKNMGNMGNMGDMFGNMGGATDKAQQMMSNPKVREIIAKAQNNPKIMKAVTECMSNPAAFAKYQNDPEVAGLINELKKYM